MVALGLLPISQQMGHRRPKNRSELKHGGWHLPPLLGVQGVNPHCLLSAFDDGDLGSSPLQQQVNSLGLWWMATARTQHPATPTTRRTTFTKAPRRRMILKNVSASLELSRTWVRSLTHSHPIQSTLMRCHLTMCAWVDGNDTVCWCCHSCVACSMSVDSLSTSECCPETLAV